MKSHLWAIGLAAGLAGVAQLANAGPGVERRVAAVQQDGARRSAPTDADTLVRRASRLLTPIVGPAPALKVILVADEGHFLELARSAGEPDATVFCDFSAPAVMALDREVDGARARLLVHEAARLHVALALGARPTPWLEEGLACCAEDAWEQDADLRAERSDTDRAARARLELRSGASLARVFALEPAAFARGERVHRDVALAWAATRRLLHGGPREGRALDAYFETLLATRDVARAERALFAITSPAELSIAPR
jgi:hypothetical protein